MSPHGELAIVLHTHMPYVEGGASWPLPDRASFLANPEGFGTWPFGEEWLWEAIATSYLPLLDVLGRAPVTLSLTPVLCDQLEAPGAIERCLRFLTEIRPESHRLDLEGFRERGEDPFAAELERSAAEYVAAAERLSELPDGLLAALGRHASWTSAATHAVLPMLVERHRNRAPGPDRNRLASPSLRRLGWRVLATGVRIRAVARRAAGGGRRPLRLRRADRAVRARRRTAAASRSSPRRVRCSGRSTAR